MSTLSLARHRKRGLELLPTALLLVLAAMACAASGAAMTTGNKIAEVVPVALVLALLLAMVAATRFHWLVALLLAVRPALDMVRLAGSAAGNTTTQTSSTRALDPASIAAVLFLVAGSLWMASRIRARGPLQRSTLRRAMLAFVATGFLSVVGAAHKSASLVEGLRILAIVLMFIVLEQLMQDKRRMRMMIRAAYLSAVIPIVYSLAGLAHGHLASELKGGYSRLTGSFSQSNDFGRYLMLMIIFGVAIYPHVSKRERRVLLPVLVACFCFLPLTYTRTALVGTALGLVVIGILQSKKILGIMLVGAIAAVIVVPGLGSRFSVLGSTASQVSSGNTSSSGNSLVWRLSYWTEVLPLANSNPITGIGLDMTQYETDVAKQPHNDYIRAYVETGILGLGAYLAMLAAMLALGRRAIKVTRRGTFDRGVAVGFLGCAIAYVAVSAAANVMSNVVTLWYLATFAAAAAAVVARAKAKGVQDAGVETLAPVKAR